MLEKTDGYFAENGSRSAGALDQPLARHRSRPGHSGLALGVAGAKYGRRPRLGQIVAWGIRAAAFDPYLARNKKLSVRRVGRVCEPICAPAERLRLAGAGVFQRVFRRHAAISFRGKCLRVGASFSEPSGLDQRCCREPGFPMLCLTYPKLMKILTLPAAWTTRRRQLSHVP